MHIFTLDVKPLRILADGTTEGISCEDDFRFILSYSSLLQDDFAKIEKADIVGWKRGYCSCSGPANPWDHIDSLRDRSVKSGFVLGEAYFPKGISFAFPAVFVVSQGITPGGYYEPAEVIRYLERENPDFVKKNNLNDILSKLNPELFFVGEAQPQIILNMGDRLAC